MITPDEIKKKALRRYGDYLAARLTGEAFFPLDIPGDKGRTRMPFEQLLGALRRLHDHSRKAKGFGYTVEERVINTRHAGATTMPARIYFATEPDYLRFIGKAKEAEAFQDCVAHTRTHLPELMPWVLDQPLKLTRHLTEWRDLLHVCRYFMDHPRPGLYIRELPVAVHTKFIESQQGILRELLEFLLPPAAVDREEPAFAPRFGLRYDEPVVRFRRLDPVAVPGFPAYAEDISLPFSAFQQVDVAARDVFILENKQTFLAFPPRPRSLVIWGKGFAVELLRDVAWLGNKAIHFWGDLDGQGFQMLHQLRTYFPQTRSLLMDRPTFDAFAEFAVPGPPVTVDQPDRLTAEEQELFQWLKNQPANRLEQERITQAYLLKRLEEQMSM